jgi:hypothetical protein
VTRARTAGKAAPRVAGRATARAARGQLPFTGVDPSVLAAFGGLLIATGGSCLMAVRGKGR